MDITGRDVTVQRFTSQDIIGKDITSHETAINYYYCDFSDPISLEARSILGAIIRELLENIIIPEDLEQKIEQFYRYGTRTAAEDELLSILNAVLKYFSKIYICIDGLDECEKNEQATILSMVKQLAKFDHTVLKFIIISREETLISTSLRKFPRLRVSADKNSLDIRVFVEETVKSNIRSGALTIRDHSLESDIKSALIDGADGM
jgi:KAP family P-loop domain